MAQASFQKPPKPIEITDFLGLNESVGNTEIKLGEFSLLENFRITKNMKPKKRPGHYTFINFGSGDVQGVWYGTIASKTIMLACWDGDLYEYDMSVTTSTVDIADLITEGTVTIIGTITDARTSIFWFDDKIYFLNGTDYKEYDGTTYQDVVPYVPTVSLDAPPTGGGTLFEESNLLTGQKKMTFVGDGSSTTFVLPESGLDSIDAVTIDGVAATSYTADLVNGQITSVNPVPANESEVEVTWTLVVAGNSDLIKNHKYAIQFGVGNDTNLFIFGNLNEKHVFRFSGVAKANYFAANSFVGVHSTEFSITALVPQYQSLLVFKEDSSYVVNPTVNPNFTDNTGLNPYNYGYEGLNNAYGNSAPNMVQLIRDDAVSFDGYSWRQWTSTNGVRNEVQPRIISDRIKLSMQETDLSTAVTYDYEFQKELWVNFGTDVYIWNYGNDTMYKYTNIEATQFIDVEGDIYYGSDGTVEHVSENYVADGSLGATSIPCVGKLGFTDFESPHLEKNMRDEWVVIEPAAKTSLDISFVTDRRNEADAKTFTISYRSFDYGAIDYGDWSYATNKNPQPRRLRAKVKKFTYLQTIFENDSAFDTLTILKLMLPIKSHRYSG